ncbi:hypothetical protein GCM10022252_33260 [Streptosporangium oxazolinicum]|uniref:Uncharacterized protein n=1 Tax=Streptosporangium oxazolinicum TaxID=909287 RepID=A0ABP8AWM0_9ACTN
MVKALVPVTLAAVLAAGCSSDVDPANNASVVSEKTPAAAPTSESVEANPLPTKMANDPGVRKNIAQTKCAAVPGGWGAEGTAKNPEKKPVTYKIVVYFTTPKATTLDYAQTLVEVPPGKTVTWSAAKQFAAKRQMLCPMPGISVVS